MKIKEIYSHLNGLEFLEARQPNLWKEVQNVIAGVNAVTCKTKVSKEKKRLGCTLFSPKDLNLAFKKGFSSCSPPWERVITSYWVCSDPRVNRKIQEMDAKDQKREIEDAGFTPYRSKNETDFVKDKVAVEVQFGKYSFVAHDLFVKHMTFYVMDRIDIGIEILPMKEMSEEMSSGPTYYEKDLNNLVRQGRGVPAVPLLLLGVVP